MSTRLLLLTLPVQRQWTSSLAPILPPNTGALIPPQWSPFMASSSIQHYWIPAYTACMRRIPVLTHITSVNSLSGHLYFVCKRAHLKPLPQHRISLTPNANVPIGGVSLATTLLDTNVPTPRHWTHGVSSPHANVPCPPA